MVEQRRKNKIKNSKRMTYYIIRDVCVSIKSPKQAGDSTLVHIRSIGTTVEYDNVANFALAINTDGSMKQGSCMMKSLQFS